MSNPAMAQFVTIRRPWGILKCLDDWHFTNADYEPQITGRMAEWVKKGDVVLDVGAHWGTYTTLFASIVGPEGIVHAFEPDPKSFALMQENVRSNMYSAYVVFHQVALGSVVGDDELRCFNATGQNQLIHGDKPDYTIPIKVDTIDNLNLPRINFIKMDVEHWEFEVIKGGQNTIKNLKPTILAEIHSVENQRAIEIWARDNGYTVEALLDATVGWTQIFFLLVPYHNSS